jgi:hypothetical protein
MPNKSRLADSMIRIHIHLYIGMVGKIFNGYTNLYLFFLEHLGELRVNVLRRKGEKTPNRQYNTHKHTHTETHLARNNIWSRGMDRAFVS